MMQVDSLYNNFTTHLYYQLNEMLKTYRVISTFDTKEANTLLNKINDLRLSIAVIAEQRQIFWNQLDVEANASGYKNDIYFTSDDIKSLVSRLVAFLPVDVQISLIQQGTKNNIFTRNSVPYQQLASAVQSVVTGQNIPFDLPQEIFLDKNDSLDIGIINATVAGLIAVHGCNLKDDYSPNIEALKKEIWSKNPDGSPYLPQPILIPIQFKFASDVEDTPAVSVDSGKDIFSVKGDKTAILTDISTTSINSRVTIIDRAKNQTLCDTVESSLIAGFYQNRFTVYYPLPYWHLFRESDRFELKAVNGSSITGDTEDADLIQTVCFRGFTI
jgi:hypothetical protein